MPRFIRLIILFGNFLIVLLVCSVLLISSPSVAINTVDIKKKTDKIIIPIPTDNLLVKSFRRDTAAGIAIAVNEWLKHNPGIRIYYIQTLSTTLGSRIIYIWYKIER